MQLLHESKYFTLRQCDLKRCFLFETAQKTVRLSFCQLLALRNKVNAMDLKTHFDEEQNNCGIEILLFCNREHVMILDTYQVIDLKAFIKETFELLESVSLVEQLLV